MALRDCLDCGRPLSEHAAACPHCGRPQNPVPLPATVDSDEPSADDPNLKLRLTLWIVFMLAFAAYVFYVVESELGT